MSDDPNTWMGRPAARAYRNACERNAEKHRTEAGLFEHGKHCPDPEVTNDTRLAQEVFSRLASLQAIFQERLASLYGRLAEGGDLSDELVSFEEALKR